ncbi:MAG: hypothetical protein HY814_04630 [Candidatus Riflebacteria bacterium]|nr:hypothetical protein [Candidatus Riflebacteria bacterium]
MPALALVETRFERLLPGATLPADAVSLLRVGMTARSRRTVLRPTADAGVRQSVVTRLSGGRRIWPGLLAGGASQPHLTLDGRASVDPNRPALPLSYRWEVLAGGPVLTTFSFTPPAAGVYEFECYALETDVALRPLGVETSRRIRVVANAPGKPVPRARATLAVAGPGRTRPRRGWRSTCRARALPRGRWSRERGIWSTHPGQCSSCGRRLREARPLAPPPGKRPE